MYVPPSFSCADEEALFALVEQHSFATLIVPDHDALPDVTHIPFHLDRERRVLQGHVARANPIWERFVGTAPTLVVFAGPHGYVSPSWYTSRDQVPTWNYAVVHVHGTGRLVEDEAALRAMLRTLVEDHEAPKGERSAGATERWSIDELTAETYARLSGAIVGFEIAIERLLGKFKLSQNRDPEDREGVLRALDARGSAEDLALASFMRTHGRHQNG